MPNGRLSSSSFATTTASPACSAGSSSSAVNTGPASPARHGCVLAGAAHERSERLVGRFEREARALFGAQRGRAFDEHVPQRGQTLGLGTQDLAGEAAVPRARFDDEERIGLVERAPAPVEGPRDARAEQRPDLGARDEIAPRARAVPDAKKPPSP